MSCVKKVLLGTLIALLLIQLIQPVRNKNGLVLPTDISMMFSIPQNVQSVLKTACYDCHSNKTQYPWYSYTQPVGWILDKHIKEGKENLNFSEFGSYSTRKQLSKLKAIENSIHDGTMPLSSYTFIHKNARLTEHEKILITDWAKKIQDSLALKN